MAISLSVVRQPPVTNIDKGWGLATLRHVVQYRVVVPCELRTLQMRPPAAETNATSVYKYSGR